MLLIFILTLIALVLFGFSVAMLTSALERASTSPTYVNVRNFFATATVMGVAIGIAYVVSYVL